jgi:hypothetical protein
VPETVSLKALARLVLKRDSEQDTQRDSMSRSTPSVARPPRQFASVCAPRARPAPIEPAAEPVADTWNDAHEERAAIIEHDAGIPRAWAEGLARLNPARPPADISPKRWLRFINDCRHFLAAGWAARAAEFSWGLLHLFGCDCERPFARVDNMGLIWFLNGGTITELHRDCAVIQTRTGARQSYRRRPVEVGRVVLAWERAPSA